MIDFWFSIGSTYTYLSIMRLAEVEQTSGVAFRCDDPIHTDPCFAVGARVEGLG